MPSIIRSYSKINLGLAIGPPRQDGYHSLVTLYQTLALHDLITVRARQSNRTQLTIASNDARVPRDQRNTAWKAVEKLLERAKVQAEVSIHIQKNLPIQGGMGAGSANAAAALIGLERELKLEIGREARLEMAAEVGSDVPLFLIGGSVLGSDRGQVVNAVPDVTLNGSTQIPCVVALPPRGVSTPQAFRDWDARFALPEDADLHKTVKHDTVRRLSRIYAPLTSLKERIVSRSALGMSRNIPEPGPPSSGEAGYQPSDVLPALVADGIENDFESVVFLQYPLLLEIKQWLLGDADGESSAVYASLSGSGSALFGLYRCQADATAAQQRLQKHGVQAIVTMTLPRSLYWSNMFAE